MGLDVAFDAGLLGGRRIGGFAAGAAQAVPERFGLAGCAAVGALDHQAGVEVPHCGVGAAAAGRWGGSLVIRRFLTKPSGESTVAGSPAVTVWMR